MNRSYFIEVKNENGDQLTMDSAPFYAFDPVGVDENPSSLRFYFEDKDSWQRAIDSWDTSNESNLISGEKKTENWNKKWEESYAPIEVKDFCRISAPFHEPTDTPFKYEILIQPQMSFGTGHHATTYLMIEQMSEMDFEGKSVLDFGSGTGILAIMAYLKGARDILAIDIDPNAVENSAYNAKLNNAEFEHIPGDINSLAQNKYDIILANVNKNTLIESSPTFADISNPGTIILLSGFYKQDIPDILKVYSASGFELRSQESKQKWVLLCLYKNN